MGWVYILHFETPLCGRVQHYIGYTAKGIRARLQSHRDTNWEPLPEPIITQDGRVIKGKKTGPGATIMGVVNHMGIDWKVSRMFRNVGRDFERSLKNTKKVSVYCPLCSEKPRDYHPKEKIQ